MLSLNNNINPVDIMLSLTKDKKSELSKKILKPLEDEYRNEWFKSEEELMKYYSKPEISKKLYSGELEMKKLNLKYLSHVMVETNLLNECISTVREYVEKNSKISLFLF